MYTPLYIFLLRGALNSFSLFTGICTKIVHHGDETLVLSGFCLGILWEAFVGWVTL